MRTECNYRRIFGYVNLSTAGGSWQIEGKGQSWHCLQLASPWWRRNRRKFIGTRLTSGSQFVLGSLRHQSFSFMTKFIYGAVDGGASTFGKDERISFIQAVFLRSIDKISGKEIFQLFNFLQLKAFGPGWVTLRLGAFE